MKLAVQILSSVTLAVAVIETSAWLLRWVFKSNISLPADIAEGTSAIIYVSGASRYWPSRIEQNERAFLRELEQRAPAGCLVIYDVFPFHGNGSTPRRSRSPLWWMCVRNTLQGLLFLPRFLHAKAAGRIVAAVKRDGLVPERVLVIANSLGATIAAGASTSLDMRIISLGGVYLRRSEEHSEAILGDRDWIGRAGLFLFRGSVIRVPGAGHMDYFDNAATLDAVATSKGWRWLQS